MIGPSLESYSCTLCIERRHTLPTLQVFARECVQAKVMKSFLHVPVVRTNSHVMYSGRYGAKDRCEYCKKETQTNWGGVRKVRK